MSNLRFFYILYKDIKRLIKRHKFSFCLIIIFILIFLCSKYNVFASDTLDFTCNYNGVTTSYSVPYPVNSNILNIFNFLLDKGFIVVYNSASSSYNDTLRFYFCSDPNDDIYYDNAGNFRCISGGTFSYIRYYINQGYWADNVLGGQYNIQMGAPRYIGIDIYTDVHKTGIYFSGKPAEPENPYILNTQTDLTGLLSETITIDAGDFDNLPITFSVTQSQPGLNRYYTVYQTVLDSSSSFFNSPMPDFVYYDIPVSVFRNYLINGSFVNYSISQNQGGEYPYIDTIRTVFTPNLSEETDADKINNVINNNTALILSQQQQIISQEQQQTEIINDTNSFLKDDSFNSSDLNLPSDSTQDITEGGINNIFNLIYNGFTSGEATDIVISIPFTNKSFTINSNLVSSVLNSNGFGWLKTIIEIFWWYIISAFIVKDISKKINKIKSGDFENIENNNIKEDML